MAHPRFSTLEAAHEEAGSRISPLPSDRRARLHLLAPSSARFDALRQQPLINADANRLLKAQPLRMSDGRTIKVTIDPVYLQYVKTGKMSIAQATQYSFARQQKAAGYLRQETRAPQQTLPHKQTVFDTAGLATVFSGATMPSRVSSHRGNVYQAPITITSHGDMRGTKLAAPNSTIYTQGTTLAGLSATGPAVKVIAPQAHATLDQKGRLAAGSRVTTEGLQAFQSYSRRKRPHELAA